MRLLHAHDLKPRHVLAVELARDGTDEGLHSRLDQLLGDTLGLSLHLEAEGDARGPYP